MIESIEPYLVNFSFIVIPLFLYQMFWIGKGYFNNRKNKVVITIIASVSILLCMSKIMIYSNGVHFDFRDIPFIVAGFYGGYPVSIPLYFIMLIYRFFLGGVGSYINLIMVTSLFFVIVLLRNKYKKLVLYKKC